MTDDHCIWGGGCLCEGAAQANGREDEQGKWGWAPALGKKAAGKVPELEGGSPPPATSPSYPSRSRTQKESLFEVQVFQAHSVLSLAQQIT